MLQTRGLRSVCQRHLLPTTLPLWVERQAHQSDGLLALRPHVQHLRRMQGVRRIDRMQEQIGGRWAPVRPLEVERRVCQRSSVFVLMWVKVGWLRSGFGSSNSSTRSLQRAMWRCIMMVAQHKRAVQGVRAACSSSSSSRSRSIWNAMGRFVMVVAQHKQAVQRVQASCSSGNSRSSSTCG